MNSQIQSAKHLNYYDQVNFGSYYTPRKYVELVGKWLKEEAIPEGIIFDPSCGYGAFFQLSEKFKTFRYIGNDIDKIAIKKTLENFPFVETFNENIFFDVSRTKYGIKENDLLVIVGNPPYNDYTSQIHQKIKKSPVMMDNDIKSRDLGLSSLLCYNKMGADYVAVLHPLSFLIKKANFLIGKNFFNNYILVNHIVFNSQEFDNTSKKMGFPILVGLYKRQENSGLKYEDVKRIKFKTIENNTFILNSKDYVCDYIDKYPSNKRYNPEILFYTLRDINALKRSRTFISKRESNAVDINPEKLSYYCYIDCFKRFADVPYYLGNFDVPFIKNEFDSVKDDVVSFCMYNYKDIFKNYYISEPSQAQIANIQEYIKKAVTY